MGSARGRARSHLRSNLVMRPKAANINCLRSGAASPSSEDREGQSPLAYAKQHIRRPKSANINCLRSGAASPSTEEREGQSPLASTQQCDIRRETRRQQRHTAAPEKKE